MKYVYILLTAKGALYCGSTNDLRRRLSEHHSGNVRSTKAYRPVKLVHYECYAVREDAGRRERFLKTTEGKRELRKQIKTLYGQIHSGVV